MKINEELNKWKEHNYKYIYKTFRITPNGDKNEIELFYSYSRDAIRIKDKANLNVPIDYDLKAEDLYSFINDADNRFFSLIKKHILNTWEQTLNENHPLYGESIDVAYYYPRIVSSDEKMKVNGTVLITDGKKVGGNIISDNADVNFELERGNISIIGWNYK